MTASRQRRLWLFRTAIVVALLAAVTMTANTINTYGWRPWVTVATSLAVGGAFSAAMWAAARRLARRPRR